MSEPSADYERCNAFQDDPDPSWRTTTGTWPLCTTPAVPGEAYCQKHLDAIEAEAAQNDRSGDDG